MIKNYFKTAWRNLIRGKVFSTINIMGLAIGLTAFLLLALYIKDELSYDRFHEKADRIYRVSREFLDDNGSTNLHLAQVAPPYGPLIAQDFPEVEHMVRMLESNATVRYGDNLFNEERVFFVEDGFFDLFTVDVVQGDASTALKEPFTIALSAPMAKKYFGDENPVGKMVRINNQAELMVSGVFNPLPAQSSMHPDFLISFATLNDETIYGAERLRTNWGNNAFNTFLLLPENYDPQRLVEAFPAFQNKHMGENTSNYSVLHLLKLTDIHLHSHTDSEIEPTSDIRYVYFFSAVALFILVIACINYMNLTTARSAKRAKEVGMRKVVGAQRSQLIRQFLVESWLFTVIALLISFALVALILPFLNELAGKSLIFTNLLTPSFIIIIGVVMLLTALLSGSYPAFFLTAFQPVKVFKGKVATDVKKGILQQLLVTTQFAIAVLLIICTTVVYNQMKHVQDFKLGYAKEQIILLPAAGDSTAFASVRQQLIQYAGIVEVGRSSRVPTGRLLDGQTAFVMRGSELAPMGAMIKGLAIDEQFIPTYQIEMAAGRNLSREHPADREEGFILNESAVKMLGWDDPADAIGNVFAYGNRKGQIIGVTKDFHFESLHQQVVPLAMGMEGGYAWWSVRVSGGDIRSTLAYMESVWKARFPDNPFGYEFLDDRFGDLYEKEQTQQLLFGIFAGIAIFISCLGLLGLSMYMAELRMKEVGIRKVLGASVAGIVRLLSMDFLKLVLMAIFVAAPIAWWIMRTWLDDFAYRIEIQWWMFAGAGFVAVAIALLTVGWQAIRAALANPVESLRDE
ncbi:ABC transporter permease [Parapedobacter koreensis]|uniref:Putative ABC transport system permease protein n=1 Tax=Parapedobacter koreensis TaxID=332977 RepID=A0A1H7R1U4_9SPHI|nr:ABC transporter permease [Parapedobacter koreensis]SEL53885.1 putative ABC transport system permease protein [Parapedobacter koreensis]